ncbi:MAG: M23 family metallopeptidase [Micromonosporaceae bacterium]
MVAPPIGPPSGAVAAVRLAPQRAPEPALRFRWPLDGQPSVVRPFDPPPRPWLAGHRGVDLAAEPGSPVRAAGGGVVRFAGPVAGRGVVSVDHPGGLRTTYEPVTPTVRAGDRVVAGDLLGSLVAGHPGCAVAACLHWGLRRGTEYLDPLALLGRAPVRLLPLDAPARPARHGGEGSRATGPRRGHARGWAWRYAARSRSRETCV